MRAARAPRGARRAYGSRRAARSAPRCRAPSGARPARARAAIRRRRTATARRRAPARASPRRARRERSHRGRFEGAPALLGGERVGELVQLAVEDGVEPVNGQLHTVVRDPVLREVVGADLLGPLPRSDLRPARALLLGPLLGALVLVQPGAE